MVIALCHGFCMRFPKGFTFIELIVSVTILMLISTATVFSLRTTKENEELRTAARLLAGDIRSIQARALAARTVLQCPIAGGRTRICENDNPSELPCTGACSASSPPRFGIALDAGFGAYSTYADVDPLDGVYTNLEERLAYRELQPLAASTVLVQELRTENGPEDASFIVASRQSGAMRIDPCGDPGFFACLVTEPRTLSIVLRHARSGKELTVDVNAITGRVSVP